MTPLSPWASTSRGEMLKIGWFSTGRGQGSIGLLRTIVGAIRKRDLDAEIAFVFCNRELGEQPGSDQFIELVNHYELPLITISSKQFRKEKAIPLSAYSRELYDAKIMDSLEVYNCDVSVLAGYMLIVSSSLCKKYKMLNLHPALPSGPAGTWQEVIWELIANNAAEHGAMVHRVTEKLDEGPPITYARFPIQGGSFNPLWDSIKGIDIETLKVTHGEDLPLFQAIRNDGIRLERPLLLETLKKLSKGLVEIPGNEETTLQPKAFLPMDISDELTLR